MSVRRILQINHCQSVFLTFQSPLLLLLFFPIIYLLNKIKTIHSCLKFQNLAPRLLRDCKLTKYLQQMCFGGVLHSLRGVQFFLFIQFQRSEDLAVSNVAVKIEETVQETSGTISKMMPAFKDLMYNIKRDLIDSITERSTTSSETQTDRGLFGCI